MMSFYIVIITKFCGKMRVVKRALGIAAMIPSGRMAFLPTSQPATIATLLFDSELRIPHSESLKLSKLKYDARTEPQKYASTQVGRPPDGNRVGEDETADLIGTGRSGSSHMARSQGPGVRRLGPIHFESCVRHPTY